MQNKHVLSLILLLALVLRLISLNQSLWLDEATSVLVARDFSVNQILTKFSPGDFHPPLYYILLKYWINLFGASEIAARGLSVLAGVGTIVVVYFIARRIFNTTTANLSALFLSTAPLHIYYSQEARMYILETFFACLVIYFMLRVLEESVKFWNWVGLTLSSALLLYTDYLPVFFLIAMFLYLLIYKRDSLKKKWRSWALCMVGVEVLLVPLFPLLLAQITGGLAVKMEVPSWWNTLGRTSFHEVVLVPIKFMIGRISLYDKHLYALLLVVPSLVFGILLFTSWNRYKNSRLVWFWLLFPIFLAALFGVAFTGFSYFRLLFVLPAFYLLVACGVTSIKRSGLGQVFVILVIAINLVSSFIYLFNPRFHREDWRGAVAWIEQHSNSDSAISIFVTKSQTDPYRYYASSVPVYGLEGLSGSALPDTIWLFRYIQPIFDPDDNLRRKLENLGYTKADERDFNGVTVWQYRKTHNIALKE